jgi:hypothetical protein
MALGIFVDTSGLNDNIQDIGNDNSIDNIIKSRMCHNPANLYSEFVRA